MTHPDFTILYVDNPPSSTEFYRGLLGVEPVQTSPNFSLFVLKGGMKLGLWSRHTVEPKATAAGGGGEIAFCVETNADVDSSFAAWKEKGIAILQQPTNMDFGYTFAASDPDGHHLRVYAIAA